MKKNLITLFLLFLAITGYSQTSTDSIKKQADTLKGLVLFKEVVKLEQAKQTFTKERKSLKMSEESGKSANKKSADSVSLKNVPENTSQNMLQAPLTAAGPTVGQLDVSSMGGATYTVPISLPPGLGNMIPQIALTYNSQGGNGVVGLGWSISGLSAITRIPTTKFHDNKITAVNFNPDDRFAMDGQRLLLKSGTYGADGAEYQTENYSNIKIVSRGVSPFGSSHGPAYFEVFFPDGSKAVYGENVGSRTSSSFAISYMENTVGARINYTYAVSDHTLIVTEIAYGNKGVSQTLNKINFHYSEINRAEMSYTGGDRLYRKSLLNKIAVTANGTGYRNYVLTLENIPTLNYKRVTSIREYDGAETLSKSPLYFTYNSTTNSISTSEIGNLSWTGLATNNSDVITADFTGDGKMDFILKPKYGNSSLTLFYDLEKRANEFLQVGIEMNNIGQFKNIFTGNILTANNKILPQQGITLVRNGSSANSFKFDNYLYTAYAPMLFQYDRVWENVPTGPTYYSECDGQDQPGSPLQMNFFSGDFNGDGLADILAINYPQVTTYKRWVWVDDPYTPQLSEYQCFEEYGEVQSSAHFVNLDRRITTNFVTNLGALSQNHYQGEGLHTSDFNGDGKTDFLQIKNGQLFVYGLNADNTALELLWQKSSGYINNNEQALLGDYNGDGKTDIMFTTGGFNSTFAMMLSTGRDFTIQIQNYPFTKVQAIWNGTYLQEGYLIPTDVNNDGKTDIIEVYNYTQNNTGGWSTVTIHHNMGTSPAYEQHFANGGSTYVWSGAHHPIPLFINSDKLNPSLEFGLLSMNSIKLARFEKDFKSEARLSSIMQDGVTHDIRYRNLGVTDDFNSQDLSYETSLDQTYPNVDLHNLASLNVVDKLTRTYNGSQLQQVFGYGKGVSNTEGLGFLGFGKVIRSNWHTDDNDVSRMFNITVTYPLLRGAPIQSLTTRYPFVPSAASQAAAQPDLTLSTAISSAQTAEASNSITLANGFVANGTNGTFIAQITNPATGVNDGATLYSYITRTDYTYNTQLLANKVFINAARSVATKDLLNGTNTLQLSEYDNYYNVTKSIINSSGAGVKTEEVTYANNLSGYYLGRPLSRKTTMSAAGDTYSSEEEFTYTGFLPTQIKKKGNGTPWITENITYDTFGNITQKTIITANGTRTNSATYDATGRFVLSQTDKEGLTSNATYDAANGNLLTTTNPFGQTTTNIYDSWNRSIESTNYLGKKSYNSYATDENGYVLTQTDEEGREKITYTDHLLRITQTRAKSITGSYVGTATEYDVYGRAYRQSQPAAPGNYSQWNQTQFDEYGRAVNTTEYTGKAINITYNGLSTTVNDGVKSITTTKNALGQTVSHQDPGGSINYNYYAHGGLKSADYGGSVQSVEYDGWGRKTKLQDPSAGQYLYTYNGFGEITQETTPKGVTNYTYDNTTGKLMGKSLSGDNTSLGYVYSYNTATKLLNGLALTNGDGNNTTYSYTYDTDKRLTSTVEDNLHAIFTKSYTYDGFGRIATENYLAKDKASNITVSRTVAYTYQNGELLQAVDQVTGKILSKVNTLKNNGQLATELQGTSLKTTYNYDNFNLPQSAITERIGTNPTALMTLGYSFDALRGNLNSRSNSAFSWSESFSYDNLDRMTDFNDNNGTNSQSYDNRGRITTNSQLGNYSYSGLGYQQTELTSPTPAATTWYQNHSLQNLTFNAFKKPVNINEQGKEQIDFQYNAGLQRAHMYFGSTEPDKNLRPMRRHYSEDGGMEITRNIATGVTSFVFYLSGDAYDAPAIYKEVHNSSSTSQNLYYLHRDHLGSIVLISDVDGNTVEKRQFDAWGNIIALTDGAGNPLSAFVITDRGYTGHEHLLGVGLINMNGRLYDSKLHRFLSPDNFLQDALNTQNYNRYGYAKNNPLIYSDPSGEFLFAFLIPIVGKLAAAIIGGAVIGAAVGAATYSIASLATGNFSWNGLGKAALIGAVSGAISGGLSSIGSLGATFGNTSSFWQSSTWGVLRNATSQFATDLTFGNKITWGGIGASIAGGFLSARLPSWKAVNGSWLGNAAGELAYNTGRGAVSGMVSGGVAAAIDGGDIKQGALLGLRNGALGGASQSIAMLATFGATYKPDIEGLSVPKGVIFRKGGIYQLLINREVTWGNNIMTNKATRFDVYRHELQHYSQYLKQGWAIFQGRGLYEQFIFSVFGTPVYSWGLYGRDKYQEADARYVEDH